MIVSQKTVFALNDLNRYNIAIMSKIDPQPASGFRDYLPADAIARQAMFDRIRHIFERYGFSPIDTPALERLDVLTGGDPEFKKQLYQARITEDDEPLGLRFDLTVPLARYIAAHADKLQMPFMRYHIGSAWRGEHAQAGRYREFTQCDADIVGSRSMLADAQIISMVYTVFRGLNLEDTIRIRLSNRKILNGLAEFLQFDAGKTPAVLRAIDKLDKQEWSAVASELKDKVGLDSEQIDGIQEFLDLKADTAEGTLDQVGKMLEFATTSHAGIEELRQMIGHLDALGIPRSAWELDLSITRGLGYYTGTVFETRLTNAPQYGSVCSGGRYDDLVSRFAPMELSGVGLSVGIDRLFAALDELGLVPVAPTRTKVLLLNFDPAGQTNILELAAQLRQESINTQVYMGHEENLKGQLAWAVKSQIPYVIIMGASEREKGVAQLKDMNARTQEEVALADLPHKLK
jgi:histidyl-tRNA synthetase